MGENVPARGEPRVTYQSLRRLKKASTQRGAQVGRGKWRKKGIHSEYNAARGGNPSTLRCLISKPKQG